MIGKLFAACACAALLSSAASAATISAKGEFAADHEVAFVEFLVHLRTRITMRTFSYAGGTQADGTEVEAGGFDPMLSLFGPDGALIGAFDDAAVGSLPADPVTDEEFDVVVHVDVGPGTYGVAVSQFFNNPGGHSAEAFSQDGNPRYTEIFGCTAGQFCDITGFDRAPHWAVDISAAAASPASISPVPLPGAAPALALGLAALYWVRRRR
ncbi:MAG: DVUA0089 family protein [Pseudomonadota bacterium]